MGFGFLPNIIPGILPGQPFDDLINHYGHRTLWMKNHFCPCTGSVNSMEGQPDPQCRTCEGRGYYWESPVGPFMARFMFTGIPSENNPGVVKDPDFGLIQQMASTITIPFDTTQVIDPTNNGFTNPTGIPSGQVWNEASLFDAYVQVDTVMRFETTLYAGRSQIIPYQQNLTIARSGAVKTYDPINRQVVPMTSYTVNGAEVIPATGTPYDQGYTVAFHASPVYVSWNRSGSYPLNRPAGGNQVPYPKRFQIQELDLFLRARKASSATGLQ